MKTISPIRIQDLKERIVHADNSGAGKAAKDRAIQEFVAYIALLRCFGRLKAGRVQALCMEQADELERFLLLHK